MRILVTVFTLLSPSLSAGEIEIIPLSPSSQWQPVPVGMTAGRSGDRIALTSPSMDLLGISQNCGTDSPGMLVRIDSITGPAGSKAAVSLHDRVETPFIAGATLLVDQNGTIEVIHRTWEPSRVTIPDEPMSFPFWVQISWDGGAFGCYLSQNNLDWQPIVLFPITFPPSSYDLLVQSSNAGEEACAIFSGVSLLGADANDNGITDGWEILHFDQVLKAGDESDPDEDGRTNLREWFDHTDPNSPDQPAVQKLVKVGSQFHLTLSKAIYSGISLERSFDFQKWQAVPFSEVNLSRSHLDNTTTFQFDSNAPVTSFYRTIVAPPLDPGAFMLYPAIWQ